VKLNRRAFLRSVLYGTPLACAADTFMVEPEWLRVTRKRFPRNGPKMRFVHFTDLHFKGDEAYLKKVVRKINSVSPEFACFTGDIVEDTSYLNKALELLTEIKCPIYGIPGNHDHWSGADFSVIAKTFEKTGGAWLVNQDISLQKQSVHIVGIDKPEALAPDKGKASILLTHYPVWADGIAPHRFDLILAGHSHGGQVRLPFVGALIVPFNVGRYEAGIYETKGGRLYVSPGIGTFYLNVRFLCRPEIAVFES
jgi:predicted MPP superfamily phosphohydrolase